jgi:hypothetical protein
MFKTYCGPNLLLSTSDARAAILYARECTATSPASPVTIERDGEELTRWEIDVLASELGI